MTRLSDSLHGLADRAPLDGVSISTVSAARRINRGRRIRAAANVTAGAGVAAVIALAAVNPGMPSGTDGDTASALESAKDSGGAVAPQADIAGMSQLAWGLCGSRPFDAEVPMVTDAFGLTLSEFAGEAEPGSTVDAALTVSFPADRETGYVSSGPAFLVLWDGYIVGTGQGSVDVEPQDLSDNTATWDGTLDLVNCWDGTALPGGGYEVVAYQDFYADAATEDVDPIVVPSTEPTKPATEPAIPDDAGAPDASHTTSESAPEPGDAGIVGPAADAPAERALSNVVPLVISGEVPENPFGDYLTPLDPGVAYPEDYLSPSTARAEFAARVTLAPWDMAEGSQRVVKTGDSLTDSEPDAWIDSYYGCSADGTTTPSFPATTANWPLLAVDVTLPSAVGLSYGWVIDNNPEVDLSVTNTSEFSLPGFWGQPNTTLFLVKDGKVVANSYLASTDLSGDGLASTGASTDGMLAPGGSLGGTFLWRDVTGCWAGESQAEVKPGTYTVLSVQDLYLETGMSMYLGDFEVPTLYSDSATIEEQSVDPNVARIAIDPAPGADTYDYVTLQVWTSLGQVTIK